MSENFKITIHRNFNLPNGIFPATTETDTYTEVIVSVTVCYVSTEAVYEGVVGFFCLLCFNINVHYVYFYTIDFSFDMSCV